MPPSGNPTAARRALHASLLAGCVLAALLAIDIGAPWRYMHDDNGAWTQVVATAHLRAGLARTRGQDFFLARADGTLAPYLHHPPLFPLTTAAVYAATGRSDPLVTRLVPATAHLVGFAGFVVLAGLLFPRSPARRILAAATYALVPMSSFFGKNTFNEPLGLAAIVWAIAFLVQARISGRAAPLAASAAAWAVAGLSSWPAYPLMAAFALASWLRRGNQPRERRIAYTLAVTGALTLALVLLQLAWAGRELGPLFTSGGHWGAASLGAREWIGQVGSAFDMHRRYFANVPFALFLLWIAVPSLRSRHPESAAIVLAGAAGSLLWSLAFVKQVALHAYGQFWFLPFEALAAADAAVALWGRTASHPRARLAVAVVLAIGTLASVVQLLGLRYSKPHGYAVRTAASYEQRYETHP